MRTLPQGAQAPDFTLTDQAGEQRRLGDLLSDGPVVLFFYPAASSGGCTKEACHFRDLTSEFAAAGARPVGISMDAVQKQQAFAGTNRLTFTLLSDPDGAVATAYGVRKKFLTPVKRVTFVIERDGTIGTVITGELKFEVHADRALRHVAA